MTLFRSEGWTETVARDRPSEPAQDVAVPAVSAASPDSRYAVMTQIWVVDHWTWTSWMCFESHAQAVAHPRKTDKVVRFSSNEWTELRQHTSTAPLPTTDATAATDTDSGAIVLPSGIGAETLVEFILRVLGACDLNGNVVYGAVHPSGSPSFGQEDESMLSGHALGKCHRSKQPPDPADRIGGSEIGTHRMAEDEAGSPAHERRVALGKRQLVAEMSPEEMRRELLTSEVTGLPNRRAFEEAGTAPAVAMSDVDGLKALNQLGYDLGDALLRAKADALREAGIEAYHDKGDEFLCRGDNAEELQARLERGRCNLRIRPVVVQRPDGTSLRFKGQISAMVSVKTSLRQNSCSGCAKPSVKVQER